LFRLALAPVMPLVALAAWAPPVLVACLVLGVLSDIFDGVIARRLGVVTPAMRRLDSGTDVLFFLSAAWCLCRLHPEIVRQHVWGLAALLALEAICNLTSLARFRRLPATHSYLAKFWGLCLLAAFVAGIGFGYGGWVMKGTIAVGVLADIEIIAIMLVSPTAPVDVPTLWHACQRRKLRT
jgi:CDP-diacylglycerol--glycerol-3-phosphate 3-phosphatidyltransferase